VNVNVLGWDVNEFGSPTDAPGPASGIELPIVISGVGIDIRVPAGGVMVPEFFVFMEITRLFGQSPSGGQ
jgi:hypothetical protein